jgi:hypothetical protein
MRTPRFLIALSSLAVVAGGLTLAPAASATDLGPNCAAMNSAGGSYAVMTAEEGGTDWTDAFSRPFALNAGEVVTATTTEFTGPGSAVFTIDSGSIATMTAAGQSRSWTAPSTDSYSLGWILTLTGAGTIKLTFTCSAPVSVPPKWLQSTARSSVTESCPADTVPSWAMWPNNGTGGYVCDKLVNA